MCQNRQNTKRHDALTRGPVLASDMNMKMQHMNRRHESMFPQIKYQTALCI